MAGPRVGRTGFLAALALVAGTGTFLLSSGRPPSPTPRTGPPVYRAPVGRGERVRKGRDPAWSPLARPPEESLQEDDSLPSDLTGALAVAVLAGPDRKPLAGVAVRALDLRFLRLTVTDASGVARFPVLWAGTAVVVVEAKGHETSTGTVVVAAKSETRHEVVLGR